MSLKHAILVLLETEPSSGYDLIKHFNNSLGYFWNAKHQQVYQQLKHLSEDGLVKCTLEQQEGKPDKKIYAITNKGVESLKAWLESPVKPNKVNDALLVKLYGGHLLSDQALMEELDRHTETHKKTLAALCEIEKTYLTLKSAQRERYKLPYLTLRRGILGEKAWLEWAEEAQKTLKK